MQIKNEQNDEEEVLEMISPVSQFPIGETRATTTARSNSYHARELGDIELELECLTRGGL